MFIFFSFTKNIFDGPPPRDSVTDGARSYAGFFRPLANSQFLSIKSQRFDFDTCREHLLDAPSRAKPIVKSSQMYTSQTAPLAHSQSFAIKGNQMVMPTVVVLLLACRPSAILGAVISIIVNPLNAVFRTWLWPHIVQKILEVISPSLTNLDSSRSVINIAAIVRVLASPYHSAPRDVFGPLAHAVLLVTQADHFPHKAAATARATRKKRATDCDHVIATVAATKPKCRPRLVSAYKADNKQAIISLTGQVLCPLVGYGHNLGQFFACAIGGNCEQWELWGMIVHVNSPFATLTTAGTFARRLPLLIGCYRSILAHLGYFRHVEGLTIWGDTVDDRSGNLSSFGTNGLIGIAGGA